MKELLIAPGIMILILGFAIELEDIAQSSADKALVFAEDMNSAMDCASVGRPIRECSPSLFETDFTGEAKATLIVLQNINSTMSEAIMNESLILE